MSDRSTSPRSPASTIMGPSPSLRVSQRPPTACRECSLRKVRCDKQTPCSRCVRLSRKCTREVVRISKSLSVHREELRFLRDLRARLLSRDSDARDVRRDAVVDIDSRIRLLEYGKPGSTPEGDDEDTGMGGLSPPAEPSTTTASSSSPNPSQATPTTTTTTPVLSIQELASASSTLTTQRSEWPRHDSAVQLDSTPSSSRNALVTAFEFLAWGRHIQACYPHRRCGCYQQRRYSELVSINCDAAWVGRLAMTVALDAEVLLPTAVARKVVRFHIDHLHWHHNAFHVPTFLDRCEQFWQAGTTDHPLWLALYLAVCSVSLWTLLNNEPHRARVGFVFDGGLVERQFQAMVNLLYSENFLEHLSLYSVQAIAISTRIAHNLDRSELNATLVGAAVRIAHCLGLHKISDPAGRDRSPPLLAGTAPRGTGSSAAGDPDWYERVEIEMGKRVWAQLVIQDHFQIPFTDTYVIHPSQYITPLPDNCSDYDMVPQDASVPTSSSYTRMLARTAALMPPLLDGLGPRSARKSSTDVYPHILACDRAMRDHVATIPEFLLRDDNSSNNSSSALPWLPLARRTLAISAAEKIIMIHRPVLFESFQSAALRPTRTTCVAAATTILRAHEQATAEQHVSIWTHSAFCVTAAVVLGLELFHRADHTDATAHSHRQLLACAADRLRARRCDAIARRGAQLIDTMLAAEEDLVLRMMRTARSAGTGTGTGTGTAAAAHQQAIINDMIGSHEIMARFLAREPPKADVPGMLSLATTPNGIGSMLAPMDVDPAQDFDVWFNEVFSNQ